MLSVKWRPLEDHFLETAKQLEGGGILVSSIIHLLSQFSRDLFSLLLLLSFIYGRACSPRARIVQHNVSIS
jgi:hypothetical protein